MGHRKLRCGCRRRERNSVCRVRSWLNDTASATLRALMKRLFPLFLLLAVAHAEEIAPITISKGDKIAIAVSGLAAADAKVLQNDLAMSGYFSNVPQAGAAFVANNIGSVVEQDVFGFRR